MAERLHRVASAELLHEQHHLKAKGRDSVELEGLLLLPLTSQTSESSKLLESNVFRDPKTIALDCFCITESNVICASSSAALALGIG